MILWLVSAGQITYLLRSYKKIKELVNEKYGEDLLTERETLREELKLTKNKLEVAEYYKNKYAKEIDEVCDQNLKLRHEISKYNNDYEDDFILLLHSRKNLSIILKNSNAIKFESGK